MTGGTPFNDDLVRLLPRLRSYARRLTRNVSDADDLVQDTVVRALARQEAFELGTNMIGWLNTIMHNVFVDQGRSRTRWGVPLDIQEMIHLRSPEPSPLSQLRAKDLIAALMALPDEQRFAVLQRFNGDSYEEIAALCGIPVGTVRSRISRGRSIVQEAI